MTSRTILVTGANRGIGLCIVRALGQNTPSDSIILGARSKEAGAEAIAQFKTDGLRSNVTTVEIDVTDDESIQAAVKRIENEFGMLDVLVNNAGIASVPSQDLQAQRASYNQMLNTNVTSVANVSLAFMPLLTAQSSTRCYKPRIINISSGRASLTRSTTGKLPPTASIPYSVSKVALNALTIEMQKSYPEVMFYVANPGHCKTQLNGFKGLRDPLEGARIVTELVQGDYEFGFWEAEYASGPVTRVPW